jgi:hypothetical protein
VYTGITVDTTAAGVADGSYGGSGDATYCTASKPCVIAPRHIAPYVYFRGYAQGGIFQYPAGSLSWYSKTPYPTNANRLKLWVKQGKTVSAGSTAAPNGSIQHENTNPYLLNYYSSENKAHYYTFHRAATASGEWQLFEIGAVPTHFLLGNGNYYFPANVQANSGNWPRFPGPTGRLWMQSETITFWEMDPNQNFAGQTVTLGPLSFDTITNEPEEMVQGRTIMYDGTALSASFWAPRATAFTYQLRYSTAQSLKTLGFSNGTDGGTLVGTGTSSNGQVWTASMSRPAQAWVGIRPVGNIGGMSGNTISPIWVMTALDLDPAFAVNDHVTISGASGNTAANSCSGCTVTAVQPRQFLFSHNPFGDSYGASSTAVGSITSITNNGGKVQFTIAAPAQGRFVSPVVAPGDLVQCWSCGGNIGAGLVTVDTVDSSSATSIAFTTTTSFTSGYTAGSATIRVAPEGALTSIASDGGGAGAICTATFRSAHNVQPGWRFRVGGSSVANLGTGPSEDSNVYYVVRAAGFSSTAFTFACPNAASVTLTLDADPISPLVITTFPAFAVAGTGNGDWTSGGTFVSTDNDRNFAEIVYAPPRSSAPITSRAAASGGNFAAGGNFAK